VVATREDYVATTRAPSAGAKIDCHFMVSGSSQPTGIATAYPISLTSSKSSNCLHFKENSGYPVHAGLGPGQIENLEQLYST
jgi:hypothetical protein